MSAGVPLAGWAVVLPPEYSSSKRESPNHVEIGADACEKMAWTIALGWPTEGEVAEARMRGARAFRCRVVEDQPS